MTYSFVSARYANVDHTSAIAMTEEASEVALSPIDTPEDWADLLAWGQPQPFLAEETLPNLEPDQFWDALRFFGYEEALLAWVASLKPSDPESPTYVQDRAFWSAVSSKVERGKFFERNHPFIEAARQAMDIAPQQLDDMWMWPFS
ncbi:hypothetical protein JP74_21345 [Devosia sp. 17-2-E-8]|nr:hypothetical protein JP74_21345 [Devosia sp. 17-2-E-8]